MHEMRLHDSPFTLIKNGSKTIELRLNDEKRSIIKIGDHIEFTNRVTEEKILVEVINLHKYNSFEELYKHFDKVSMGIVKMKMLILKIWNNIILKKNKICME